MSKVVQLKEELKRQKEKQEQAVKDLYENSPLTDDEKEKLEELGNEKRIVVVEEQSGTSVEISLDKYLESVDSNINILENNHIKLLSSDVMKNKEKVLNESKKEVFNKFREATKVDYDDEKVETLSDKLIEAFKTHLNIEKVNSDTVIPVLYKKPLDYILKILPEEFNDFIDNNLVKVNNTKAKNQILSTIQLLISVGPELDGLNEYIEHTHKMIEIMLKLNEANIDFYNMIKDKKSFSEIVKEILRSSNELNNTYKKYTQVPDLINNIYTQKIVVNNKLVKAYERILSEETDPDYINALKDEINKLNDVSQAHKNVLELTRFREQAEMFVSNIKIKKKFKKPYDVERAAAEVIELINKLKLNLPFPGYINQAKLKEIMISYNNFFEKVIAYYNEVVNTAIEHGDNNIKPVECDPKLFGWVILIIMGRILKRVNKSDKPIDKYELHATFEMLCKLGGELFMMDRIHAIIMPIINEFNFK